MKKIIVLRGYLLVSIFYSSVIFLLPPAVVAKETLGKNLSAQESNRLTVTASVNNPYTASSISQITKLPLSLREIPQSASIINQQRIQQQNLTTLNAVLDNATGVISAPFHSYRTLYYVRGFPVNSFEIDGIPVLLGTSASSPQDISVYEKIELLRGADGLLHGTGNPGATVNMVRKRAPHQPKANIQLQAASWNHYRTMLDIGGELNSTGTIRGRSVISWEGQNFFFDRASQKNQLFFVTLDADITENTLFNIGAEYQSVRWKNPNIGGVPLGKNYEDLKLPRSVNFDANWTRLNYYTTRIFSSLDQSFTENWKGKISLEYQRASANNRYGIYWGNVDKTTGDGGHLTYLEANKFKNNSLALDANVTGNIEAFGLTQQFIAGMSYSHADVGRLSAKYDYNKPYFPVNVYHFDPYLFSQPALKSYKPKVDSKQTEQGIYAIDRIKLLPKVTLVAGGRQSWWKTDDIASHTPVTRNFVPHGGLIWDFAGDWSWYASFSRVFQPQSYYQWQGNALEPLRGDNYETGIKAAFGDNEINMLLALFRINLENNPVADGRHKGYYINGGKAHSQGVELEINGNITPYWNLFAGYSWINSQMENPALVSKQVFNSTTPAHILRVWTNYDLPLLQRRLSIGAGVQAQSSFMSPTDHNARQPGYWLANMRLGYRINDQWSVAVNVNNLFDKRYYSGIEGNHYNNHYGTPREFILTVNGNFF